MSDQNSRVQPPFPPYTTQQAPGMRQPMPSQQPQRPGTMPAQPLPQTPPPSTSFSPPPMGSEAPPTVTNPYYLAGYLRTQIGRFMRIEFSLGTTGSLNDRIGILQDVGASYVVLRQFPSDDLIVGDLYSIKFITIYDTSSVPAMPSA